jgi:hypothetical protein
MVRAEQQMQRKIKNINVGVLKLKDITNPALP